MLWKLGRGSGKLAMHVVFVKPSVMETFLVACLADFLMLPVPSTDQRAEVALPPGMLSF